MVRWASAAAAVLIAGAASGASIDDYRWDRRVLLAFAPSSDARTLSEQRVAIARRRDAFDARDLVFIEVAGDRAASEDGVLFDAAALRRRFKIPPGGRVAILVGKDGGEKLRVADRAMPLDLLYEAIDAMPMRRREMMERGG